MTGVTASKSALLVVMVCLAGMACQLKRPETTPGRMIEPQLLAPQPGRPAGLASSASAPAPVRLLDTQSRGHIGRRVLHQQPDGELTEDPVWRWSSAPDRYLDTALRLELTSSPVFATRRCGQRSNAGHNAAGLAARVWRRDAAGWGCRVPLHADRPCGQHTGRAGKRDRVSRSTRRSGRGRGPPLASPRRRRPDACGERTMTCAGHSSRDGLPS